MLDSVFDTVAPELRCSYRALLSLVVAWEILCSAWPTGPRSFSARRDWLAAAQRAMELVVRSTLR